MLEDNEKFAFICFNRSGIHHEFPSQIELPHGYIAATALPGKPDSHWREWLGSTRAEQLEEADLYIGCKMKSKTPAVLDDENQRLEQRTLCLYWAIHLTGYLRAHLRPIRVTGVLLETGLDVRSVGEMDSPHFLPGTPLLRSQIDVLRLNQAAELAVNIDQLYGVEGYPRFKRIFNAFTSGINENLADIRLHQFIRCIEGFILPDIGNTKQQFKSRTELFVGPSQHVLMNDLYDLRSRAEHLHDVLDYFSVLERKEKLLLLYQRAFEAEGIARYCIFHFLSKPELWPYFKNDGSLKSFWNLDKSARTELWGESLEIKELTAQFDTRYIRDDELLD